MCDSRMRNASTNQLRMNLPLVEVPCGSHMQQKSWLHRFLIVHWLWTLQPSKAYIPSNLTCMIPFALKVSYARASQLSLMNCLSILDAPLFSKPLSSSYAILQFLYLSNPEKLSNVITENQNCRLCLKEIINI